MIRQATLIAGFAIFAGITGMAVGCGSSGTGAPNGAASSSSGSSSGGSGSSSGSSGGSGFGSSSGSSGSSSGSSGTSGSGGSSGSGSSSGTAGDDGGAEINTGVDGGCGCMGKAGCAVWPNVYITWYGFNDNSGNTENSYGSSQIALSSDDSPNIKHTVATEGTGTYDDPITAASSWTGDPGHELESYGGATLAAGTLIYNPEVRKYFIMEDSCLECGDEYACKVSSAECPGADTSCSPGGDCVCPAPSDPNLPACYNWSPPSKKSGNSCDSNDDTDDGSTAWMQSVGCMPGKNLHIDFWMGPSMAETVGTQANDLQTCEDNATVGTVLGQDLAPGQAAGGTVIVNPPPGLPVATGTLFSLMGTAGSCPDFPAQVASVTCTQ